MQSLDNFIAEIKTVGQQLEHFSKKIDLKEEAIRQALTRFNQQIQTISIAKTENAYTKIVNNNLNHIRSDCSAWLKLIDEQLEGVEFINKFEKSIVFVIFGNVNVGKSSLGNFVAGISPDLTDIYQERPKFYSYDFADKSQNKEKAGILANGEFRVDFQEATTSVQYFTLFDSLTWVDTPGIHSINYENEELAKQYVNYADMVLFLTSSSSPAQQSEYIEISRLIEKQKPLFIVITKSDEIKKEVINNKLQKKLLAKSSKDRSAQEKYVKSLVENNKEVNYIQSLDIVSLSTKLAENALKNNDKELFDQSGVPAFYSILGKTLKQNALKLKEKAPKDRVNALINDIISGFVLAGNDKNVYGLLDFKKKLENLIANITQKIREVEKLDNKIIKKVKESALPELDIVISKLGHQVRNNDKDIDANQEIIKIITSHFNQIVQIEINKVLEDYKYQFLNQLDINVEANIKAVQETYQTIEYEVKEYKRDPEGLIEYVSAKFFGKEYTDYKLKKNTVYHSVVVGDNATEVLQNIDNYLAKELQPVLKKQLTTINEDYFKMEKTAINDIIDKINALENNLKSIKY